MVLILCKCLDMLYRLESLYKYKFEPLQHIFALFLVLCSLNRIFDLCKGRR